MIKKLILSILTAFGGLVAAADPLWAPPSSRYFVNKEGKAVYLSGWHTWNNFQELSAVPRLEYEGYLDSLVADGANFIRLWNLEALKVTYIDCPPGSWGDVSPLPYQRTGPGLANDNLPKFNLNLYDPVFFTELSNRVAMASSRGIYVMVMFFEAIEPISESNFDWSPYNAVNNVNGGVAKASDVFTLNEPAMTVIYDNYVKKVVDTLNGFDNVLFEPANEPQRYSSNFISHVIDVVHAYERTKPKQHPVIYSSFYNDSNDLLFAADNADWIAPGATLSNRDPAPYVNAKKPWLMDTDHIWFPSKGGWQYVWKCFLRGYNFVHMDTGSLICPNLGWGMPDRKLRRACGDTVRFANRMDLINMVPSTNVSSTAHALFKEGHEYLVWQPVHDGSFTVQTTPGNYDYEWFVPEFSMTAGRGSMTLSGTNTFVPPAPYPGGIVLYLKRAPERTAPGVSGALKVTSSNSPRPVPIIVNPPGSQRMSGTQAVPGRVYSNVSRTYTNGTGVMLTAPSLSGGKTFHGWFKNGAPYDSATTTFTRMETNQTLTAAYIEGLAQRHVSEAEKYSLVYSVELPDQADYNGPGVVYDIDTHGNVRSFSRIAYYLELQPANGPLQYVWVSMDAFTQDASKIGVPTAGSGAFFQQPVANMNVLSSIPGVVTGDGLTGGHLEFWPGNYAGTNALAVPNASSELYDWGDGVVRTDIGYGSMQVHNSAARQTIFAFNGWGAGGGAGMDLGIGNYTGAQPDWTFAQNGSNYVSKTLEVYVLPEESTRTLSLQSFGASGVLVAVTPMDWQGRSDGPADFSRVYAQGEVVTLTAPLNADGLHFQKWQKNGVDFDFNATTSVRMDAHQTLRAVYRHVGPLPPGPGRAVQNVAEAAAYSLIYALALPTDANYNQEDVPYHLDNHRDTGPFERMAYYLELQTSSGSTQYVWVSMDAFTQDAAKIGLPTVSSGAFFQQPVANMNVRSSVAGIMTGDRLSGGNLEFWPGNYGQPNAVGVPNASDTGYDWGDFVNPKDVGYGSMQVHNAVARQTVFAVNGWGAAPNAGIDIGIGNGAGPDSDWTLAQNAAAYSARLLEVYILAADSQ